MCLSSSTTSILLAMAQSPPCKNANLVRWPAFPPFSPRGPPVVRIISDSLWHLRAYVADMSAIHCAPVALLAPTPRRPALARRRMTSPTAGTVPHTDGSILRTALPPPAGVATRPPPRSSAGKLRPPRGTNHSQPPPAGQRRKPAP